MRTCGSLRHGWRALWALLHRMRQGLTWHAPLADLGSLWRLLLLSTAESGMHWFSRVDVSALSLRLLLMLTLWAASCGLVGGHMLVVMKAVVAKGHPRGIAPLH